VPFTYKTTNIKIPQIARWRVAGISDRKIAQMLGMSGGGLAALLATQEYIDYEAALMNGHLSAMDRALAGKVEAIHNECRQAVPAALRCLVDTVTQRRDLKAALAAAKEILDRDPDRSLMTSADQEPVAPGVPAAIIDQAAAEANKIAEDYNKGTGKPN
jgi:CTP:molybdopterin cytidylyltransferase MocA